MSKITEYERNHAKKYEKQCNDRRRNEENMVAEREEVQLTEEREDVQYHKQRKRNEMEIVFDAVSCNESFARVAVAAFITHLNPTLEELADIKTAVSEAVTNAIIHGYPEGIHTAGMGKAFRRTASSIREKCGCTVSWMEICYPSRSQIRERESRILRKPWNLYLPRNRNWTAPAWGLLLWKLLWTTWR